MVQRKRGNNWIGWLIFIVLVFGSRLMPPLAAWLSQVTGLAITPPMLIAAVVGLGVLASVLGAVGRGLGQARSSSETRLPTTTALPPTLSGAPQRPSAPPRPITPSSPPPAAPRMPSTNLPPARLPSGEQRLPGPPRFEPIIDPRILGFGILGLFVFGGFFLVALLLAGAMP